MPKPRAFRKGPIGAIIDELETALEDYKTILKKVSEEDFVKIVVPKGGNPNLRSIQGITDHVLRCGYFYPTMVVRNKFPSENVQAPAVKNLKTKSDYIKAFNEMLIYNENLMKRIKPIEMFELDGAKQINTGWGLYDYEQIMEHGIVHVYRHRRQVQQFILKMSEEKI